jgi:putative DNA primase/helicase
MHSPIDYLRLADELLSRADRLLPQWLQGGRFNGAEYVCGDLSGGAGTSLSINVHTGMWADFANPEDKGGDLISLYAAIHDMSQPAAARELMDMLGWVDHGNAQTSAQPRAQPSGDDHRPEPPAWGDDPTPAPTHGEKAQAPAHAGGKPQGSDWHSVTPVPPHAPKPSFKHHVRPEPPQTVWAYERDGHLLGYVCRFVTSDGGKDTLPHTWCTNTADGRGLQRWHWKQWDEPRPLYLAAGLLSAEALPVVLVEGEKCAQAGHKLLGHEFDFVSWPGGSKAWAKADWSWLQGRTVIMWPDADSQRQRLTRAESQAGVDKESKPLLPEAKQPGMACMLNIGTLLATQQACTVTLCPIPKPGNISDGWDIADAIEQGWDAERVRAFILGAKPFRPPDDEAAAKVAHDRQVAGAGTEDESNSWRADLIKSGSGAIKPVRENCVLALESIAEVQGVIAYNEFTNDVMKLKDAPWGSPAGIWAEVDELLMGEWLARVHFLPSMPRGTLEEAVRMVAFRKRYHPVRSWLQGLKWDGQKRLSRWLETVCLEEDEHPKRLQQYMARVGTWFLQGMVSRVMEPGVKFDYMLILEGKQGRRKSTVFKALAGDFFADTGLEMGNKDSYQQLQGRWLYEFAELDAMAKSEVTKVKAFVASASDYFRASFDKRARDYPRQIVFGGTTNEETYLTDPTGGRRFWPVQVTREAGCDIEWLMENRDQLFAEAMQRWRDGARMFPTMDEEQELFQPEQETRAVDNPFEISLREYLYVHAEGQLINEISSTTALAKIGIGVEKLGAGNFHVKQITAALKRLGWKRERTTKVVNGERPWLYHRPRQTEPGQAQPPTTLEADDPSPF